MLVINSKEVLGKKIRVNSIEGEKCNLIGTVFSINEEESVLGVMFDFNKTKLLHPAFDASMIVRREVFSCILDYSDDFIEIELEDDMFPVKIDFDSVVEII